MVPYHQTLAHICSTLYIPSYLLPSSGAYLECFPSLQFLTTRTGLPAFQSLAVAPLLVLIGASQFLARPLQQP